MICSYCGIYCGPGHILETHGKELVEEHNSTILGHLDLMDMTDLDDMEIYSVEDFGPSEDFEPENL